MDPAGLPRVAARENPFPPELAAAVNQFIADTRVRVFYVERPYAVTAEGEIDLGGYRFTSTLVRERFGSAASALVMGASALPEDAARIARFQDGGDLQRAVVLDAVLSEKADFGLDFIEQETASELRRAGPPRAAGCPRATAIFPSRTRSSFIIRSVLGSTASASATAISSRLKKP